MVVDTVVVGIVVVGVVDNLLVVQMDHILVDSLN